MRDLVGIVCHPGAYDVGGFCGGPGHALDLIDEMTAIDAVGFARAVLAAEGIDGWEHSEWRAGLERLFRGVFADDVAPLEDERCR